MFVARMIPASRSIGDAVNAATPPDRASSHNNSICHSSCEMYCVEGSATEFSLLHPTNGYLVRTNHYLDQRMRQHETLFSGPTGSSLEVGSGSTVRYHRALTLTRRQLGETTVETLTDILSGHVNRPSSICNHEDSRFPIHESYKTTYAVVSDLTRLEMHTCLGNPCAGRWGTHRL